MPVRISNQGLVMRKREREERVQGELVGAGESNSLSSESPSEEVVIITQLVAVMEVIHRCGRCQITIEQQDEKGV